MLTPQDGKAKTSVYINPKRRGTTTKTMIAMIPKKNNILKSAATYSINNNPSRPLFKGGRHTLVLLGSFGKSFFAPQPWSIWSQPDKNADRQRPSCQQLQPIPKSSRRKQTRYQQGNRWGSATSEDEGASNPLTLHILSTHLGILGRDSFKGERSVTPQFL